MGTTRSNVYRWLLGMGATLLSVMPGLSDAEPAGPADLAMQHLCQRMDACETVYAYRDFEWGGNAACAPSGWMGDHAGLTLDPVCREPDKVTAGTCVKVTYAGTKWAGVYWQHPDGNWGKQPPRAGLNLTGATRLLVRACADADGQPAELGVGGINGPFGDSCDQLVLQVSLSREWREYEVPLAGQDLSHVVGVFFVALKRPGTVYLDEIRFDLKRRPDRPHFIPSYVVPDSSPLSPVNRNAAFLYDQALVMVALSCRARDESVPAAARADSTKRLKVLADTVVFALEHDRAYRDGRLRNGYWGGGDLADHTGTARLSGWYDPQAKKWLENRYAVSSYTGNLAWTAIALLEAWTTVEQKRADGRYLQAAQRLMAWLDEHTRATDAIGGFTGGYDGWEATPENPNGPTKLQWRATEHNLDVLAAARRLAAATGAAQWQAMADHAAAFLERMFNAEAGHYWSGTLPDGALNREIIPLDCQTWAVLALGDTPSTRRALAWAKANLVGTAPWQDAQVTGYAFGTADQGVWPEGTAQMGLAWLQLGNQAKASAIQAMLRTVQAGGPATDGRGLVAACREQVDTGFDGNHYYRALHLGATAWFYLLEKQYNPFLGRTCGPPPAPAKTP